MDDLAATMQANGQENAAQVQPEVDTDPTTPLSRAGLRGGFATLREKASLQDRLVEKYADDRNPTKD